MNTLTRSELIERLRNDVKAFSTLDWQDHVALARAAADMLESDEKAIEALETIRDWRGCLNQLCDEGEHSMFGALESIIDCADRALSAARKRTGETS